MILMIPTTDLTTNYIELENQLNYLNNEIIKENMAKINLPNAHSRSIEIPKSSMNDIDQQEKI